MQRLALALVAALAAALVVVSLSAAAHQRPVAKHRYPHRIVSLSPTVTEDLFALGAGKQVIAVDQDSNYPRRAPRTSLSGFTPNSEAIANYHPDLVLISYNPSNFASQLRKLGIKVVIEPAANNLPQAYREILGLGRLTGHDARREGGRPLDAEAPGDDRPRACRSRAATCASTTSSTRRTTRPRRRRSSAASTSSSASATSPTRRTRRAAATRSSRPSTSSQQNPQIVVLADTKCCQQTDATVAARPGWGTIAAVQHHRVVGVDDDVASRWGPRIVQFAQAGRPDRAQELVAADGDGGRTGGGGAAGRGARRRPPRRPRRRRVPRRGARDRPRGRAGAHPASARSSARRSRTSRSSTSTSRSARSTARCSGSCARRGSRSPRSSAGCSRSPAPRIRASSGTRSADPYLLGVAGGAGLGATLAIVYASAAAAGTHLDGAARRVRRRDRRGRRHVRPRPLGRRDAHDAARSCSPASRSRRSPRRCRPSSSSGTRDMLQNVYSWLLGGFSTATWTRRRDLRAVHRGELARARPAPPRARRPQPRRRRGREPRRSTSRARGWRSSSRRRSERRPPSR